MKEKEAATAVAEASPLPDGYAVLALDPEFSGSCPCATVEIDGQTIQLHCWRVCERCEYVGIHYEGAPGRAVAERIKPLMDGIDWYGEWTIAEGFR